MTAINLLSGFIPKVLNAAVVISVFGCLSASGKTFSDISIGYSIVVPEEWDRLQDNDSLHSFYDTSSLHVSRIFISKHTYDLNLYSTPEAWTLAKFEAYKISIDYSGYPYAGYVLYFDSTQQRQLDGLWAPELYACFILADTLNPSGPPALAWSEFLKVTAVGAFGYEIYALGDTADMLKYVDFYDSIMISIDINPPAGAISRNSGRSPHVKPHRKNEGLLFDLRGRAIPMHFRKASGWCYPYGISAR
jgi:hypothetical protein